MLAQNFKLTLRNTERTKSKLERSAPSEVAYAIHHSFMA